MSDTASGIVINLNAYGATVRLDDGDLASASVSDVENLSRSVSAVADPSQALGVRSAPRRPSLRGDVGAAAARRRARRADHLVSQKDPGVGAGRWRSGGGAATSAKKTARGTLRIKALEPLALERCRRDQTLRPHLDRHEFDCVCRWPTSGRSVPRTELARSTGTRLGEGLGEPEGDSATSRCSARSTRSLNTRGPSADTTCAFLPWPRARFGARRTAEAFAQRVSDLLTFHCACSRAKRRRRRPIAARSRPSKGSAASASASWIQAAEHRVRSRRGLGARARRLMRNRRGAFDGSGAGVERSRRGGRGERGRGRHAVLPKRLCSRSRRVRRSST